MVDNGPGTGSRRRRVWRGNILALGLVSFFTDLSSEMMNPLLPIFIAGLVPLGLAPVFVGLVEGVAETTASLLKLASGRLSDHLGKRKALVVAGYGLSTAARPLLALAGLAGTAWAGWQVVGLKFLDRVGKGVRTSPRDALISDSVGPDVRGLAFSFTRAMDHAGAVGGSLLAIVVLFAFLGHGLWRGSTAKPTMEEIAALRWVFALALIPGLLALLTLAWRVREIAPKQVGWASAHADQGTAAGQAARAKARPAQLPARFYAFVGIVVIFTLGNSSDMFLLLYAWEKFHLGLLAVIGLWIALHISKIVFSLPGGFLADRIGRRPLILAGWVMYALVYLGLSQARLEWQFWALFLAYGFYYGTTEGAERALVADFVPVESRGTGYGVYNGAIGLAALPGSLLFGVFWATIGPGWAFGIGAGLAALAASLLLVLLAETRGDSTIRPADPGAATDSHP
ncbi:MAG: MFS transporter [Planctomycetes bacterium]|jgi:MFS family permease|nr:MFS transporter [Planctomycetota bacterium]